MEHYYRNCEITDTFFNNEKVCKLFWTRLKSNYVKGPIHFEVQDNSHCTHCTRPCLAHGHQPIAALHNTILSFHSCSGITILHAYPCMTLPINACISTLMVHIIHSIQTHFVGIFSLCA
jgi:hypothetical protein